MRSTNEETERLERNCNKKTIKLEKIQFLREETQIHLDLQS